MELYNGFKSDKSQLVFEIYDQILTDVNMYSRYCSGPWKGSVRVSPVGRVNTLGMGGPGPPVGAGERQLSPDRGGEKT